MAMMRMIVPESMGVGERIQRGRVGVCEVRVTNQYCK